MSDIRIKDKKMGKKYRVTLSEQEQTQLKNIIGKRSAKSVQVKRSYILLAADENGAGLADEQISRQYQVGVRTIERLRERFVGAGLAAALQGKKRQLGKQKAFDGRIEAHLVACGVVRLLLVISSGACACWPKR